MKRPSLDLDDPDVMRRLLLKGRNRNDVDREVIEDLGFRISLWNGEMVETSAASISLLNGCYSPRISNVLYLGFPGFGDLERNDELARRLVDAARHVLDADWVMLGREIDDPRERPFLDRAMFLSSRLPLKLLAAFPLRWRGANVTSVKSGKIFLRKMEVAS